MAFTKTFWLDAASLVRQTPAKLFAWMRQNIYVAAVLDGLGFRNQAMRHRLRPLDPKNFTIVGRALTFRWMETDYVVENDPYGLEMRKGANADEQRESLRDDLNAGKVEIGWRCGSTGRIGFRGF